ncbi:MFS transporter [Peribacillus cavernae]|uniref:MFS transporter n=1 Tax=Peribacillus cavernae TaxID=1674310 RepID=A0A3S0U4M6_9BACI|nr:MFS transporter [Peribacillus cavernae]MDQ0218747.1 MFS family permease [Peribacillus cavernae]RUQ30960.1 MFS transporter [Peribacillus cavernae]
MEINKRMRLRIIAASLLGTTIEWYDFFLYGTAASLVFGGLFFPKSDPDVALLLSYATFVVAFVARPLGSVIFSYIGDRIGRKAPLIITLTGMGIITTLIGLLPGYNSIGFWAPLLLIILRFLQGIAMGGEWGGVVVFMNEHSPKGKRGFYGGLPNLGVPLGLLLSTAAMSLMTIVAKGDAFIEWGWRIPFIASVVLVGIGFWIRSGIPESLVFQEAKESNNLSKYPLRDAVKYHWVSILKLVGVKFGENVWYYIITTYVISYATGLGYSSGSVLNVINIAALLTVFTLLGASYLTDFVSRRSMYIAGATATILFAIPYFYLVGQSYSGFVIVTIIALSVIWPFMITVQGSLFPQAFPTNVRYTGVSLVYGITAPLVGLAPFIATYLNNRFDSYIAIAIYLMVAGVISLVSVFSLHLKMNKKEIENDFQKASKVVLK